MFSVSLNEALLSDQTANPQADCALADRRDRGMLRHTTRNYSPRNEGDWLLPSQLAWVVRRRQSGATSRPIPFISPLSIAADSHLSQQENWSPETARRLHSLTPTSLL